MLTTNEQLFLELVNAARLDPEGEAARQGVGLNQGLEDGTIPGTPVQPLAPNAAIQEAAADHGSWMLETDTFDHDGIVLDPEEGPSDPGDRMEAAGYDVDDQPALWGENLAWLGHPDEVDPVAAITRHHDGLYESPDHRPNLFNPQFRETGTAQALGNFTREGTTYDSSMLTHKFGLSGSDVFLTGAVYDDADGDGFYSTGEGRGDVEISAQGSAAVTWDAGGYVLPVDSEDPVSVTLGSGADAMEVTVAFPDEFTVGSGTTAQTFDRNVKLDLVDGDRILTSGDITLGAGAREVALLGAVDNDATGNAADNTFHVGRGDNTLIGGGGTDRVMFSGAREHYEITDNGDDTHTVRDTRATPESDGVNTLSEIAYLEFSDTTLSLLPPGATTELAGQLSTPGGEAVPDTALRFTLSDGSERTVTTEDNGDFQLSLPDGLTGHLEMASGAERETGLEVGDALNVLRLAVGLEPSFGPATPHDMIAADVDFSGEIDVGDALDVLRAAVGLDTEDAQPGAYVLLDPEQSLDGMDADNVSYSRGMDVEHGDAGSLLTPEAVILGDLGTTQAV